MAYRVVITPVAKRQLDMYVAYTAQVLKNRTAAKNILEDAKRTMVTGSIIKQRIRIGLVF